MRCPGVTTAAVAVALALSGNALASQLVDRNATGVKLEANTNGKALLVYRAHGASRHVLVWGAMNALFPSTSEPQVKFKLDYSGGPNWQGFTNMCVPYDGPALPDVVAACKLPDGSYWAAQQWAQPLPDLGFTPWTAPQSAKWLEISHWQGPTPTLSAYTDWVWGGRFQEVFGVYTYAGKPVHGFGTTRYGAPTDGYGRLIFLDTFDSPYGSGWRRENSFVPHNPTGVFCYGFYKFDPTKGGNRHPAGDTAARGPGLGTRYRLIALGPGVEPNVATQIGGLHPYDPTNPADVTYEQQQVSILKTIGDKSCLAGHRLN
ncbi:MAG TPA: hypothetical protein VMU74_03445 [Gaiellaceae bacterium]|nr:hypothetical protein [Gaiellaceae bacterium]